MASFWSFKKVLQAYLYAPWRKQQLRRNPPGLKAKHLHFPPWILARASGRGIGRKRSSFQLWLSLCTGWPSPTDMCLMTRQSSPTINTRKKESPVFGTSLLLKVLQVTLEDSVILSPEPGTDRYLLSHLPSNNLYSVTIHLSGILSISCFMVFVVS